MLFRAEWDQLLVAARSGDVVALGNLITAAREDLHAAAAGVLGRSTQARLPVDEVFSDALIAVVREIGTLRATNYIGFRYWFASIARNNVRRTLRRDRARNELHAGEDPEPDANGHTPRALPAESLVLVRDALLRLPQGQQVAYVLREGLALSWRTIGFVLAHRAPPAARLLHYRATLRMKEFAGTKADLRPVPSMMHA